MTVLSAEVMALAQAREIDAVLVTDSPLGPLNAGPVQTLDDLHSWKVSVLAQTGAELRPEHRER